MKEGGTSLNKTFREYNLVFKGLSINRRQWVSSLDKGLVVHEAEAAIKRCP